MEKSDDDYKSTFHLINKDSWLKICLHLKNVDACNLRQTCKHLYNTITHLDQFWYLEYEWFLIRTGQYAKSMCCKKGHTRAPGIYCINESSYKEKYPKIWEKHKNGPRWTRQKFIFNEMIKMKDGKKIITSLCKERWHYGWIYPKKKSDIIIGDDYRKRKGRCVFWYLIACYRQRRESVKEDTSDIPRRITKLEHDISTRIPKKIQNLQKQIEISKKMIEELKPKEKRVKLMNTNKIFFNKVAKTYKSPLLVTPSDKKKNQTAKKRKRTTTTKNTKEDDDPKKVKIV